MNWRPVARLMARDARRSHGVWVVVGLFAVMAVVATTLPSVVIGDSLTAVEALVFLIAPMQVLVAVTGLLAGYGAIAGPRSGGQLGLVLGQPIERGALVVGAFVGRTAVVLGGLTVGIGIIGISLPIVYGGLPAERLATFAGLLALLAVAVTAVAIGISAVAGTRGRAAVAAVGAFVLFQFFWDVVPAGAHYLVEGSLPGPVVPGWVVLLERLQPLTAFEAAATHVLPDVGAGVQLSPGEAQATDAGSAALRDRLEGPPPAYLDPWVAVVTLVGWAIVPLAIGWHWFRRVDL